MSHVFPRHCLQGVPFASKGDGCYLYDKSGKQYLDACGGASVTNLGHNNPEILAAIDAQLKELPFAHTAFFTNEASEKLATQLVYAAPEGLSRVYFTSGGSEAMESALKLAYQYHCERNEASRRLFISRRQSYHGNTLGVLAVGGNMWRKEPFQPILTEGHHIAPCYAYRGKRHRESDADYGRRVAAELESKILELGAENVAAFVAETVVGATAGAVPAVAGYFQHIRRICDRYGVLLILDEVMCGTARTGSFFACEQDHVVPDMVAIAKGLAGGYVPLGALLAQEKIYQTIAQGSGFFQHGHTFIGHPTACAAANKVVEIIQRDYLPKKIPQLSMQLCGALQQRFAQHPWVGNIRGRGLFLGLELVRNRSTKAPHDPNLQLHKKVKAAAMEVGLMCYPMAGTIDGQLGNHILLAPQFIMQENQVEELVDKLALALDNVMSMVGKTG